MHEISKSICLFIWKKNKKIYLIIMSSAELAQRVVVKAVN